MITCITESPLCALTLDTHRISEKRSIAHNKVQRDENVQETIAISLESPQGLQIDLTRRYHSTALGGCSSFFLGIF